MTFSASFPLGTPQDEEVASLIIQSHLRAYEVRSRLTDDQVGLNDKVRKCMGI